MTRTALESRANSMFLIASSISTNIQERNVNERGDFRLIKERSSVERLSVKILDVKKRD